MTTRPAAPATINDLGDAEQHEAELARRYPDAEVWYGTFTHTWWALVKDAHGTWRHLEASGPYNLADQLDAVYGPCPSAAGQAHVHEPNALQDSARPVEPAPEGSRSRGARHSHRRTKRRDQ